MALFFKIRFISMAAKTQRTSISLTTTALSNLDYCARNLGVTRSAFVNELLEEPLSNIKEILERVLPPVPSDSSYTARRTSSEVQEYLRKFLKGLGNDITALDSQIDSLEGAPQNGSKH